MTLSSPLTVDNAPINALDPRGLAEIRRAAKTNDPKAIKAAAQQFEALFMQMVLKSMRDAMPREGLFDSEQSRMYESLLDQQMSQVLASKKGVGLADVIQRQWQRDAAAPTEFPDGLPLERSQSLMPLERMRAVRGLEAGATGAVPNQAAVPPRLTSALTDLSDADTPPQVRDFVNRVMPDAVDASRTTGIPAAFLIAHAALETGWGKHEPRASDGSGSNNLFGIKAGNGWTGASVQARTTEVIQGVPQQRTESFRAYGSYAESFRDYARLLTENPRYAGVLGTQVPEVFAAGLQRAGYATDPNYAAKLGRVIDSLPSRLTASSS